jgi:transcriptional regulator with XRE-family HTH domain/tetratricopeptide (TPR) repeat protein
VQLIKPMQQGRCMNRNHPLKYERELRGWSQAKVAEELGTTSRTVSRWENGLAVPYPYFREQLCSLFGKNAVELGLVAEDEPELAENLENTEDTHVLSIPVVSYNDLDAPDIYDPAIPIVPETSSLIGRATLLAQFKERLYADGSLALTAVNGLPGVGKTALAVALATDPKVQEHFHDGILWVGLGTQPNVLSQLARWGMLLDVSSTKMGDASSWEAWGIALHEVIGMRRMLLVIDDAWKIEEALAFQIGGLNCAHLLTTRIPQVAFAFAGEKAIEVPQLNDADGLSLIARFVPELVTLEAENVYKLVHSVGALPLALTLMGKYLALQAFTRQPRRLYAAITQLHDTEQRLRLSVPTPITSRSPSLSAGIPLSLHAAIAVSDQRISKEAHKALQALSVLPPQPNSFSEEMALAVTEVTVEALDELSDAGLLESNGPGRYTLHQTISDYARIQNEERAAQGRFVQYCIAYVKEHQNDNELLDPEMDNILAAFDIAYQTGRHAELLQGVDAFIHFLRIRGLHSLVTERLLQAYSVAKVLNSPNDIINIASRLGEMAQVLGANIQAEDYLLEGLVLARQLGDQAQICRLLAGLGERAVWQGDLVKAEAYCQEGLEIGRLLEIDEPLMVQLTALGWVVYVQQDYVRAAAIYQEALNLARRLKHQEYISRLLACLGWTATARGNYVQADAYYQEGLVVARGIQHKFTISLLRAGQGWLAGKLKKYTEAEAYTYEGLLLARQMGFHELTHRMLTSMGWLAEKRNAYGEADAYYQEALSLARQHKRPQLLCLILFHTGMLRLRQEQFEAAGVLFREMLKEIPEGHQDLIKLAQGGLARLAIAQGSQSKQQGDTGDDKDAN